MADDLKDVEGSSPHARGAHWGHAMLFDTAGIIPACAGSTSTSSRAPIPTRDHPRMRGEHCYRTLYESYAWGSSPHARGAQVLGR